MAFCGRLSFRSLSRLSLAIAGNKVGLFPNECTSCLKNAPKLLMNSMHLKSDASFHTSAHRFNEHIINIQDADDFKAKVTQNKVPVIVDFHATWCGPCKLLGPRLESLVSKKEGKVVLAKVDIDDLSEIAIQHGVEAVPTVIAIKNGKQLDKFVGLKDDAQLKSFIDKLIGD